MCDFLHQDPCIFSGDINENSEKHSILQWLKESEKEVMDLSLNPDLHQKLMGYILGHFYNAFSYCLTDTKC